MGKPVMGVPLIQSKLVVGRQQLNSAITIANIAGRYDINATINPNV